MFICFIYFLLVSNFCLCERLVNVPGIWWEWQWWSPSGWSFFSSWVTEKIEKAHLHILVSHLQQTPIQHVGPPKRIETLGKPRMATLHLTVYLIYFNIFDSQVIC